MRILIIADEVWDDQQNGNNVLTNWFSGFDAEFAEIYCNPGAPNNNCCLRYLQLTDAMMVKSMFGPRAGRAFLFQTGRTFCEAQAKPERFYRFMKAITTSSIHVIRDLIWLYGRYDMQAMSKFIQDFSPDIVFCPRLASPKLLRLERTVAKITSAPIIAFTGDDEVSTQQINYSPIYWVRRYLFRRAFKKTAKIYSYYFMHSQEHAQSYQQQYGIQTGILFKCGNFEGELPKKTPGKPLKLIYAGRLYCNRWKTLKAIGDALKEINADGEKMILEVYTPARLSNRQSAALSINRHIYVKGNVSPSQLTEIYQNADIALHVESFDKRNMYATRFSFSTKIIDCMASSCAVMAICWDQQTGFQYLHNNDAAFCISSCDQILPMLRKICDCPELINEYAQKAWHCGQQHHSRAKIQNLLKKTFKDRIHENFNR